MRTIRESTLKVFHQILLQRASHNLGDEAQVTYEEGIVRLLVPPCESEEQDARLAGKIQGLRKGALDSALEAVTGLIRLKMADAGALPEKYFNIVVHDDDGVEILFNWPSLKEDAVEIASIERTTRCFEEAVTQVELAIVRGGDQVN